MDKKRPSAATEGASVTTLSDLTTPAPGSQDIVHMCGVCAHAQWLPDGGHVAAVKCGHPCGMPGLVLLAGHPACGYWQGVA